MLLRDERQVALNDVETLCIEAADRHEAAARRIGDDALARLLGGLAALRRRQAGELAQVIRASGDLPNAPDRDRQDVRELLSMVMPVLTGDERINLINEAERIEDKLEQALAAALAFSFPPPGHALLVDIDASVRAARRSLAEQRPA